MSDWYFKPSQPKKTDKGIKARSKRGAFAKTWWAERWIEALEELMDAGRLRRGQRYARQGQVLSIRERDGVVTARVQGSSNKPYNVTIALEPLGDAQWDEVLDALAEQALFAAQLLAGEMPADIDTVFRAAGVSLFPSQPGELETSCSCPDWAEVCKHVAAAHYILGERFDEDPFLLFRLRGRSAKEVMAELRARRGDEATATQEASEASASLHEELEHFWDGVAGEPLKFSIKSPTAPFSVLRRLGQPSFLREDIVTILKPAYEAMSEAAIEASLGEEIEGE
jgi:uncharacterized Zn finger protein